MLMDPAALPMLPIAIARTADRSGADGEHASRILCRAGMAALRRRSSGPRAHAAPGNSARTCENIQIEIWRAAIALSALRLSALRWRGPSPSSPDWPCAPARWPRWVDPPQHHRGSSCSSSGGCGRSGSSRIALRPVRRRSSDHLTAGVGAGHSLPSSAPPRRRGRVPRRTRHVHPTSRCLACATSLLSVSREQSRAH